MKRKIEDDLSHKHPRVVTRLVLNKCHGGFGLSPKAITLLLETLGYKDKDVDATVAKNIVAEIPRHHPALVYVIEELGTEAWVPYYLDEYIHRPMVVEIPVGESDYEILYQNGWEIAIPRNFETPTQKA